MTQRTTRWRSMACALSLAALGAGPAAQATVVEFQTVLGNFQVNLFDETTPLTVANFLDYVNNGGYTDSIVHRSDSGFIIQGGGFIYDGTLPIDLVPTNPAVANEPELSNVRGTISMAKLATDPNSATSQWFINLQDNSAILDDQNEGFTAFGIVLDDGMDVVDAIAALERFNFSTDANFGSAFAELPLRDYIVGDGDPDGTNLVVISAVVVTDTTVSTNIDLLPPENTLVDAPPVPVIPDGTVIPTDNGGGGALGSLGLVGLGLFGLRRRWLVKK